MNFYTENETDYKFDFRIEVVGKDVAEQIIYAENCPVYPAANLVITDNEGIRELNKEFRGIDAPTDVLSFPNIEFETPGVFDKKFINAHAEDYIDPVNQDVHIGDIVINIDRLLSQAEEYGHSVKREFAYLIAHSTLHLCGYDHQTDEEAKIMNDKAEAVLTKLGITRD